MGLAGRTIALAEGRQLEELAQLLEREGAVPLRFPLLSILDPEDDGPVVAWLHDLILDRFPWVILFTGEGVRRLIACAERHGLRESVLAALGRTSILTRGPKPGKALQEIGLKPTRVAAAPTTDGVIATLGEIPLQDVHVGVQLYREGNPPLLSFLADRGATAHCVLPYHYAPASSAERVVELIDVMIQGKVDVLVFTSSPQIDRLFEVAQDRDLLPRLLEGLGRTQVAAVGPIVADNLRLRQVRVDICPEQGWVMKNLVARIKRAFGG